MLLNLCILEQKVVDGNKMKTSRARVRAHTHARYIRGEISIKETEKNRQY